MRTVNNKSRLIRVSSITHEILRRASIHEDRTIQEIVDELVDAVFDDSGKRRAFAIVSKRIKRKRRSLIKKKRDI